MSCSINETKLEHLNEVFSKDSGITKGNIFMTRRTGLYLLLHCFKNASFPNCQLCVWQRGLLRERGRTKEGPFLSSVALRKGQVHNRKEVFTVGTVYTAMLLPSQWRNKNDDVL